MTLEETLQTELKALRGGTGLSEARLREQATLVQHLDGQTIKDKLKALVDRVARISDNEQQTAVRYALGIEGDQGSRLTKQRRKAATECLSISERTLIRRELDGLNDLAHVIIERSPSLTEQQREEAMSATATAEDRIDKLERLVAILGLKVLASQEKEGEYKQSLEDKAYEGMLDIYGLIVKMYEADNLLPPLPPDVTEALIASERDD